MSNKFESEKELQGLMTKSIERDELSNLIVDTSGILGSSNRRSSTQFPQFSIDHLSRLKSLEAGKQVLQSLKILVLLTEDDNVSVSKGEVLRPDIVCINPEQESVVLFELKKHSQTGRQALTELLAYEQEIKNLLPLTSNYDFNFVLVSPEWSTLMDHAASSAIAWSNRKILCLKSSKVEGKLRLETHIPQTWKITGTVSLPAEAISSVTVCLYPKDAYKQSGENEPTESSDDDFDIRLITALEVMAREGDRLGVHGFAILWKDYSEVSITKYNITVCGISPFALLKASIERGNIADNDGQLIEKLKDFIVEYNPSGHSDSLMTVATSAYPLLREVSDPAVEGLHSWETDAEALKNRAEPLMCEFWGTLGEYAREYVMHPAVRTHRRSTLMNGLGNWRDPSIGLPLIQSFANAGLFIGGSVKASDAFWLGKLVGLEEILRLNIQTGERDNLLPRYQWNHIELMTAVDEVSQLANSTTNVQPPSSPLKFYSDPLQGDEEEHKKFLDWVTGEFFQKSPVHCEFFELGYNGALVFDSYRNGILSEAVPEELVDRITNQMRISTLIVLSQYQTLDDEGGLWGELVRQYDILLRSLGLQKGFAQADFDKLEVRDLIAAWNICLEASNHIIDSVFHKHNPVSPAELDWTWMKQGVSEARARGEVTTGVILLQSGQIVTGQTLPDELSQIFKIEDFETQVHFLDQTNGIGTVQVMTWDELEEKFSEETKDDGSKE